MFDAEPTLSSGERVDILRVAEGRLGPGTLYGAISRLEARGLIEALAPALEALDKLSK